MSSGYPPVVFSLPRIDMPLSDQRENAAHRQVRERWRAAFPDAIEREDIDRELFMELANQYLTLVDSGIPFTVGVDIEPNADTVVLGHYTRSGPCLMDQRSGLNGFLWPDFTAAEAAERWYDVAAIRTAAGRWIGVFDVPATVTVRNESCAIDEPTSIGSALSAYALDADRHIFLKVVTYAKYGIWKFDIPKGTSPAKAWSRVARELGYATESLGGRRRALLASEIAPMRNEYRLIVVDGKVVAGAGCIAAFDPYFAIAAPFDIQVEEMIGSGDVRADRTLVREYVDFANDLVLKILAEAPAMRHFTLDLATVTHEDGPRRIVVVECNPLFNFGQYGLQYAPVLQGIIDYCAQHSRAT